MTTEETEEPEDGDRRGMTEEQWAWFQKATRGNGDQDRNGVDLSLLRRNLRLTSDSPAYSRPWIRSRRGVLAEISINFRVKDRTHLLELEALRRLIQGDER